MCYSALVKRSLDDIGESYEPRIYPGYTAPVYIREGTRRVAVAMRYGTHPPQFIYDPKRYTTFNARRDNLASRYWADAFSKRHGVVELEAFYEWVAVSDLLQAGRVKISDVEQEFRRQAAERKAKIEAQGKRYKPTPTELKDPRFRQIVIEFRPEDGSSLWVPAIFTEQQTPEGKKERGFAIVTDDPPPEISAAGHDRCPVILRSDAIEDWLDPTRATSDQMISLLSRRTRVSFTHWVAAA